MYIAGNNSATFTGDIVLLGSELQPQNAGCMGDTVGVTTVLGGRIRFASACKNIAETWLIGANVDFAGWRSWTMYGRVIVSNGVTVNCTQGGDNGTYYNTFEGEGNVKFVHNANVYGTASNTLSGKTTIEHTALRTAKLGKTGGAIAVAGDLDVKRQGIILYAGNDQVADTAAVLVDGTGGNGPYATLQILGYSDTVSSLTVAGGGTVDTTGGGVLTLTDELTVDGAPQDPGTYTSADGWVTGEGSVVLAGPAPVPIIIIR